jgi:hypothetical protein
MSIQKKCVVTKHVDADVMFETATRDDIALVLPHDRQSIFVVE